MNAKTENGRLGELQVRILEGRNIKAMDLFGHPFVEFWLDENQKERTETRHNANYPVWLKENIFQITSREDHLYFRLIYQGLVHNHMVGETIIDLEPIYTKFFMDVWVNVGTPKILEDRGEIHIVVEYFPSQAYNNECECS